MRSELDGTHANEVVGWRTKDLTVGWRAKVDASEPPHETSVSSDGAIVIATTADTVRLDLPHRVHVQVWNREGEAIARHAIDSLQGIQVSRDGKLFAVARRAAHTKNTTAMVADIYETTTGKAVASVVHSFARYGKFSFLSSHMGKMAFTPDGRHFITSGNAETVVWRLG